MEANGTVSLGHARQSSSMDRCMLTVLLRADLESPQMRGETIFRCKHSRSGTAFFQQGSHNAIANQILRSPLARPSLDSIRRSSVTVPTNDPLFRVPLAHAKKRHSVVRLKARQDNGTDRVYLFQQGRRNNALIGGGKTGISALSCCGLSYVLSGTHSIVASQSLT
ncbi:hypothetical protein BCR34DRAFT_595051 [Clohesyomyces aquaticus]|uniref:Uncharacterized protein n=1 Tax=Clohesyomyces aquaticus TaxID=1231657 RepID=A0A1Y1XZF9_9PLEO|nr:hypothetical protein BCR34DRAFT_595051 [Clohesyomyces aquaticus]